MFTNIIQLITLCVLMSISTFVVSLLPLKLSQSTIPYLNLNVISQLSSGILLGTAYIIILPEGLKILSSNITNLSIGLPLILGFFTMHFLNKQVEFSNAKQSSLISSLFTSSISTSLILHGLIDGISLGSSFLIDTTSNMMIYLAIIVHKLPTAFSLSALLLEQGLQVRYLYWHLLFFALSTPLSSFLVYLVVNLLGAKDNDDRIIGLLFLYSAGNFIYVINHIHEENDYNEVPSTEESDYTATNDKSKTRGIYWEILGLVIPILLSFIND